MDDLEVQVRAVESVGPEAIAMTFDAPEGFDAAPGQFIQLSVRIDEELVQRYFTLSSPGVRDTFEITVSIDPEGKLGPWLADRVAGDTVQISGPYGEAYYDDEGSVVVLAAGPGIGPAIGIGEKAREQGAEVAIVVPEETDVHADRLAALIEDGAHVFRPADGLTDPVVAALGEVGGTVFVYGFAGFVSRAVDALEAAGADSGDAKVESFGPGPDAE